ncbi:MAG TPA: hypothetical protein DER33_03285 [Syntrophomonas sp.]|nr:hypothetical protein [Syntrophomonas sp.]HCF70608.1 hypothetical protein [Syntrophomonas sp.]
MEDLLTIWTPVVISRLVNDHNAKEEIIYHLDETYDILEDIKIKLKEAQARMQGKAVEVTVKLELLCLVRDQHGRLQLVNREEKVMNRIAAGEFSHPFTSEKAPSFVVNLSELKWMGEIKGQQLKISYRFDYMVLVIQEQVVQVSSGAQAELYVESPYHPAREFEDELAGIREEKEELRQKVLHYEKDINSLKRGLHKTENRNADLNREVNYYQQLVQQLQKTIQDKEKQLSQIQPEAGSFYSRPAPLPVKHLTPLTARLKRMFATIL